MLKEELMREILAYIERKGKSYFTKDDLYRYLLFKHRSNLDITIETLTRKIRELADQGFLHRVWKGQRVYYVPIVSRIRAYLYEVEKSEGSQNRS
ncbi:MAG: hypothetical protein GXO68_05725 [Crenarchaeota archaeon]|nr:hypothetical protein [Thermoproteota archaeon]